MKQAFKIFCALLALLPAAPALAAVLNPVTADDLQTALNSAAGSAEDDTINLQANTTYNTNQNTIAGGPTFTYNSANDGSLTIVGAGAGSSVVDGNGVNQVMALTNTAGGGIQVQGFTMQNGATGVGSGLSAQTQSGAFAMQSCDVLNNSGTASFAGLMASTQTGGISLSNSNFIGNNATSINAGVTLSTSTGALTLDSNVIMNNDTQNAFAGLTTTVSSSALTTLTNNTITGNDALAGPFAGAVIGNGNRIITNNSITDNTAVSSFAGVFAGSGGDLTFTGNTLTGNNLSGPGSSFAGAFVSGQAVIFNDNTIADNLSAGDFAGLLTGFNGSLTFNNNTLSGNDGNGAIAGLLINGDGPANINANTVSNHDSTSLVGFTLNNSSGQTIFTNNIVNANIAADFGGGVLLNTTDGRLDVINNTITGNASNGASPNSGGFESGLGSDAAVLNLFNNIIFPNSNPNGPALDIFVDLTAGPNAQVMLFNNDFAEACFDNGGGPNCDFAAFLGANQDFNLIAVDPLFIDPAAGNFQLGAGSPVIDQGDVNAPSLPATDHDGNSRVVGSSVDMGALEAQPDIGVNPTALNFGTVGINQSNSLIITISNDGMGPVDINGLDLSDDINYSIDVNAGQNPCGSLSFTLDSGESCTIGVLFTPTSNGTFDATLTVNSDDPDEPAIAVSLTGIGQLFDLSGGGCSCSLESAARPSHYLMLALLPMLVGILRLRFKRR